MTRHTSVLVAIATLGAGLIHLAVGAGAPIPLLLVFVAIGVADLAWTAVILVSDRVPAPWFFVATALGPIVVWALCLAFGAAASLPPGPLAAASLLGVAATAVVVVGVRRRAHDAVPSPTIADPTEEHPWRFIGTLVASATIVAAIVTPALSGTWAGQYAVPHGSHDAPVLDIDEHGGH